MRTAIPLTVLATTLACSLASAPAHARARVFVASYGSDSNPCTFGSPCKTFQHAHDVVDAGGEITAIDSAGFGPINITKAVTITSPDGIEAGIVPAAGSNAITINAQPSDAIVLRGLTLDGSGVAANGIVFNSGGILRVANCVAQNFVFVNGVQSGFGILIQPSSGTVEFVITDTKASNNVNAGISYLPTSGSPVTRGTIDHVVATSNSVGINIVTANSTGDLMLVAVSNSIASNNGTYGMNISANSTGTFLLSIDNISANANETAGINAENSSKVLLGRSVITANPIGVENNTPNTFFTYKDNRISGNYSGTDIVGSPLNGTVALQ
jgi:hypothetical protein